MAMPDYPVTVGVDTDDGIIDVACMAVSPDTLDGFLACWQPLGRDPAGWTGLRVHGDLLLVDRDRVATVDVDIELLADAWGDGDD
jgi:hypothetical protein